MVLAGRALRGVRRVTDLSLAADEVFG